jgi:hypothetical protein
MCEYGSMDQTLVESGRATLTSEAFRKIEKELQQLSYDIGEALVAEIELLDVFRASGTHAASLVLKESKDHLEKGCAGDSNRSVGSATVTMASSLNTEAASVSRQCKRGYSPYGFATRRNPISPLKSVSFDLYSTLSPASKAALIRHLTRSHGPEGSLRSFAFRVCIESPTTSNEDEADDSDASDDRSSSKGST